MPACSMWTNRLTAWLILILSTAAPADAQSGRPDVQEYADTARRAVKDYLKDRGQPAEQLRIELIDEIAFPPECQRLHDYSIPPGTLSFGGRVVTKNWKPLPGARLFISGRNAEKEVIPAVADSTGTFQVVGLQADVYRLRVEADGFRPLHAEVALAPGVHRVFLRMEAGPYQELLYLIGPGSDLTMWLDQELVHHLKVSGGGSIYKPLPAIALVGVYRGKTLIDQHNVLLDGKGAHVVSEKDGEIGEYWEWWEDDVSRPRISMPESEKRWVHRELARFFDAFLDVSRGPERLRPFMANTITCQAVHSDMIDQSQSKCSAERLLEAFAFFAWTLVEGNPGAFYNFIHYENSDYWLSDQWVTVPALIRAEFRAAGLLRPKHQNAVRAYLRRLVGSHVQKWKFTKQELERARTVFPEYVWPFPSGTFYVLQPAPPTTRAHSMLLFARQGTSLRLVLVHAHEGS